MTDLLKPGLGCRGGAMCVGGTADKGVSGADLLLGGSVPLSDSSAGVAATVFHSSSVSRAGPQEDGDSRLGWSRSTSVAMTTEPEAARHGAREAGRRWDKTVGVAASSNSRPPVVEVHVEPQDQSCSKGGQRPTGSEQPCVEPLPATDLQHGDSQWCVIETPTAPLPLQRQQPEPGGRESNPSSVCTAVTEAPAPKTRRPRLQLSAHSNQVVRRNSTCCVISKYGQRASRAELAAQAPRQRPSSAVVACVVAAGPGPLVSAAEVHPELSGHLARGSNAGVALTAAPTLRVSRASSRRHSGRSASVPRQQRWKNVAGAMRRYREEQVLQARGADRVGTEEEEGGEDRLVRVVFDNVCYLLPVKPGLPKQEEHLFDVSDLQHEPPLISKCGSLEVTFTYDSKKSKMVVNIHRAREIPAKDRGGANSTQVRVMLLPTKKQRFKTKVKEGQDPTYDETFTFSKVTPDEVPGMGLRFRLYGLERMRRERMIGESVIGFASLNLVEPSTHWVILEPRSNLSHGDSGFDVSSLSRSDSASSTQSLQHGGMPELLVGLAYNGTTGRLAVQIIKGSNFRNMAMNRAPDTYVKVTLMSPTGQELQRCKTSMRRGQPNPLFKETFMLQVALFQLPDVTLMVSVYNKKSMKKKEMIGWFSLGQNSSGEEESAHWTDMRESKGDEVCRWHVLLES